MGEATHDTIVRILETLTDVIEEVKPNDRSELDREYAILRTQAQILLWAARGMINAQATRS